MALLGNVVTYFGADPTGTNASDAAFQDAADSVHPIFVPPGEYRLDTGFSINRAKSIECFGHPLATGYIEPGDTVPKVAKTLNEQVRFIITANINAVTFSKAQIWWKGGCFDFQNVTGHTKAAFYLKGMFNGDDVTYPRGWGHGIDAMVMGKANELRGKAAGTGGTIGVHMDFAPYTLAAAYFALYQTRLRVFGCDKGYFHGNFNPSVYQWNNLSDNYIEARDTRTAVDHREGAHHRFRVKHVAGPVFPSQAAADATPSIYAESNVMLDSDFLDFGTAAAGGYYFNSKTYDLDDDYQLLYPKQEDTDRAISLGTPRSRRMYMTHKPLQTSVIIPNATQTELRAIGSWVNINGKSKGAEVFDTTNNRCFISAGNVASSNWVDPVTGSTFHTPV